MGNILKNDKPLLLIDMDRTLCDYDKSFRSKKAKNPNIYFPQSLLKFFEDMEPIDGAVESYNILKEKYDIKILTRPSVHNALSYMEKRLWVEKHLGFDECKNLILCYDKTLVRGEILIDDMIQVGKYIPEWKQIQIQSEEWPNWSVITKYLMEKD